VILHPDDNVIQEGNSDKLPDLSHPPRYLVILRRRVRIARRVIVGENQGSSSLKERRLENLPGMGERSGKRSNANALPADRDVPPVQVDSYQALPGIISNFPAKEANNSPRT